MAANEHPFDKLVPDFILDAIEYTGLISDARLLTLNSFENRVYQVGIEDAEPIIAKFYRPDRWSEQQILEEHEFSQELLDAEIDIVAPMTLFDSNKTLYEYEGFYIALFPRRGGHPPEIDNGNNLAVIGRLLGRMHAIGRSQKFQHRPTLDLQSFGIDSYEYILENWMPSDLRASYKALGDDLISALKSFDLQDLRPLRVHGDFHPGNMIHRDNVIHMVDLDDCRSALAIQDIWMLLSGDNEQRARQLDEVISAYSTFHDFDWREVKLIEMYRTLRILQQAAWIGQRWQDPAFPLNFTWFAHAGYWSQHILSLREQLYALQSADSPWN